jgi:hypothetical protein
VTIASGGVASGAYSSGALASGSVASGAFASGALATGSGTDGWNVTEGTKADSAYAGSGSASIVAALKGIYNALVAALPAGTNLIGKVGIDQTTVGTTNGISIAQIGANTVSTGAGATGTGTLRVGVAQDSTTLAGSAPGTSGTPATAVVTVQGPTSGGIAVPVSGTVAATQSGTWNVTNVSGTVSLPTGAATAANQEVTAAGTSATSAQGVQGVTGGVAMNVAQATGSNLHIVCDSGCSSSTAPADEATFTAGTTSQTPVGGFFQTTATANPLTTGQMGALQVTANRALFTNLRSSAGVEQGTASAPLQVSVANTASNGTSINTAITGTLPAFTSTPTFNLGTLNGAATAANQEVTAAGTSATSAQGVQGVTGGVAMNVAQATGSNLHIVCDSGCSGGTASNASSAVATSSTNGATNSWLYAFNGTTWDQLQDDGSKNLKVNLATAVPAGTNLMGKVGIDQTTPGTTNGVQTLSGSTTAVTQATASNLNATVVGAGTAGTPSGGVVSVQGVASGTALPVSLSGNQAVNVAQVNGVTVSTGTGAQGTGTQRVAVATDTATVAGSASIPAGTNIMGKVGIDQTTPGTTNGVQVNAALPAGTNLMGKVGIDQTTVGTTNGVSIAQIGSTTVSTGTGAQGAGAMRVTVATDTATVAGSASLPAGTNLIGKTGIDQTTVGTTNGVSLAQIGANTVASGNGTSGTGNQRVNLASDNTAIANWGQGATGSAVPSGSVYHGGVAQSSEPSKATTGNLTGEFLDLTGKAVTSPYANRENAVRGEANATGTSATTLIAAGGSNVKTYITDVECGRDDAGTTAMYVTFNDVGGTGSGTQLVLPNSGGGGGNNKTFNIPLVTAANTAFTFTASTSITTIRCSAQGFSGY